MIYTFSVENTTDTPTTSDSADVHELADYYREQGRAFTVTTDEDEYRSHTKTEHTAQCCFETCETHLEHFNERVIPGHPLAWSWHWEMIEELNAEAVAGGEWAYCWR